MSTNAQLEDAYVGCHWSYLVGYEWKNVDTDLGYFAIMRTQIEMSANRRMIGCRARRFQYTWQFWNVPSIFHVLFA